MTPIEEIKDKTKILEDVITELVRELITEVGDCDVSLSCDQTFLTTGSGLRQLISTKAKITVTI